MSKYQVPSWAASAPTPGFYLEILKEGAIIDTIDLDKTHFVFGRQHDIVDIPLDHPSISRQHAALQFRVDDGALMLLDLGSAQSTFVNKNKLDSSTFKRVYVGDIVKFGSSTRSYIVNGPEDQQPPEYDSENLQAYRKKLQLRSAKAMTDKLEAAAAGVSWGFREDAENEEEEEEEEKGAELPDYIRNDENYHRKHGKKFSAEIDESTVDEKDKAILEKIRGKERKIQNMQEENRRIYVKETSQADGLTEGQVAAVNRNDENVERLKDDIQVLVEQLKSKKAHRDGFAADDRSGLKTPKESASRGAEDDDSSWDTTDQTADVSTNWRLRKKLAKKPDLLADIRGPGHSSSADNSEPLTYEELKVQRDRQLEIVTSIQKRLADTVAIATGGGLSSNVLSPADGTVTQAEDDLDSLLTSTRAKEAASSVKQIKVEEANSIAKLKSLEKLLKIATPALSSLAGTAPALKTAGSASRHPSTSSSISSSNSSSSHAQKSLPSGGGSSTGGTTSSLAAAAENNSFPVPSIVPAEVEDDEKSLSSSSSAAAAAAHQPRSRGNSFDKKEGGEGEERDKSGHNRKKRTSHDTMIQMQSLSSFMKFAEEEKHREDAATATDASASSSPDAASERKRPRVLGPSLGGGGGDGNTGGSAGSESFGGATVDDSTTAANNNNAKGKKVLGPSKPAGIGSSSSSVTGEGRGMLQGGEKAWVPPKNQAGDGRTALNDKLGY